MKRISILLCLVLVCGICAADGMWVKGNINAHTTLSGGDSTTAEVAAWYRGSGYNFLVIADPASIETIESESFILIPGKELAAQPPGGSVHINALGIAEEIETCTGSNRIETAQSNIDMILKNGGIPIINHPNYYYSMGYPQLSRLTGFNLLEIANQGWRSRNEGDMTHVTTEQLWDRLLSDGMAVYAVASDGAKCFKKPVNERWEAVNTLNPKALGAPYIRDMLDRPGGGFIVVHVNRLTPEEVLNGIRKGDFYASTGIELNDYSFDGKTISIKVKPVEKKTFLIRFIGKHGQFLQESIGMEASYTLTNEEYVRAKIIEIDAELVKTEGDNAKINGRVAWTQPVRRAK